MGGDGGDEADEGDAQEAPAAEEAELPKLVLVPLDRPLLYIVTGHEDGCVRFWSDTVRVLCSAPLVLATS